MDLIEIDEDIYGSVAHGVLVISDEYGVEVFEYGNEAERNDGAMRLADKIARLEDEVERDLVFVENGELTQFGSWDGSQWSQLDLPGVSSAM